MAFADFHDEIAISKTDGTSKTVLPVTDMDLRAVPYSGSGSTVTELVDGRRIKKIDGWRYTVSLNWDYLTESEHSDLRTIIDMFITEDSLDFWPDPDDNAKTIEVVANMEQALQVRVNLTIRQRPATLQLESVAVDTTPKSWIPVAN